MIIGTSIAFTYLHKLRAGVHYKQMDHCFAPAHLQQTQDKAQLGLLGICLVVPRKQQRLIGFFYGSRKTKIA